MDRTLGPRLKIERAKEHIANLHDEWSVCLERKPFGFVSEDDPDTGDLIYRVLIEDDVPDLLRRLSLITGDAIHNLRSALDLLAWQLVESGGGTPGRHTCFPIADGWKEFESRGPSKIKGASPDAIKLLKRIRPYKGGNDALYRLHRLDVADKHRLLLTVGSVHKAVEVGFRLGDWETPAIRLPPRARQFPLVHEAEIYRIEAGDREAAKNQPEPKFVGDIAFGEGEVVKGEPIFETLSQLVGAVEQIVELFSPILNSRT